MSKCFDNCGDMHGFCNESSGVCECIYPWVNLGDLVPLPNLACSVHFEASKAVWAVAAALHALYVILLLLGLFFVQRGTRKRTQTEFASLLNMLIGTILIVAMSVLEAGATIPGSRSVGVDTLTTVLFCVAEFCYICHGVFLPFVPNGTSILPFAMEANPAVKRRRRLVNCLYLVLFLAEIAAQGLLVAMSVYPDFVAAFIASSMTLHFTILFVSGLFTYILTGSLLKKVSMLNVSAGRDLSNTQKSGIQQTRIRATNTQRISVIVMFGLAPQFLAFAVPVVSWRVGWAWLPLRRMVILLFDIRYPYLSLTTSCSHKNKATEDKTVDENDETRDEVSVLKSTNFLIGSKNSSKSKKKKKLLTRVEEERTVDIRTEQGPDVVTF